MKTFALLLALLMAGSASHAQFIESENTVFGVHGGFNVTDSKITFPTTGIQTNTSLGFYLGGSVQIPFSHYVFLQPQINYDQKRVAYQTTLENAAPTVGGPSTLTIESHLNEIEIPLKIKVRPLRWFALVTGPEVAYLFSVNSKQNLSNGMNANTTSTELSRSFQKIDAGLVGGLEFYLSGHGGISLMYHQSIKNLVKDPSKIPYNPNSIKPMVFQLGIFLNVFDIEPSR